MLPLGIPPGDDDDDAAVGYPVVAVGMLRNASSSRSRPVGNGGAKPLDGVDDEARRACDAEMEDIRAESSVMI